MAASSHPTTCRPRIALRLPSTTPAARQVGARRCAGRAGTAPRVTTLAASPVTAVKPSSGDPCRMKPTRTSTVPTRASARSPSRPESAASIADSRNVCPSVSANA